jgi:hypothetical protein
MVWIIEVVTSIFINGYFNIEIPFLNYIFLLLLLIFGKIFFVLVMGSIFTANYRRENLNSLETTLLLIFYIFMIWLFTSNFNFNFFAIFVPCFIDFYFSKQRI